MALNYAEIHCENLKRYGTDIGRIGKLFFADTYADRTHFIFEPTTECRGRDCSERNRVEW